MIIIYLAIQAAILVFLAISQPLVFAVMVVFFAVAMALLHLLAKRLNQTKK